MRQTVKAFCFGLVAALSACALTETNDAGTAGPGRPFVFAAAPPPAESLRAADPAAMPAAADAAARFAAALERGGGRGRQAGRKAASQVPLLFGAPEGAAYRAQAGPRALVLGDPAARCPARAAAGGPTPRAAARAALSACFAELRAAGGADPGCGCRVIAAGDALLGAESDFAYAPGVSARLISPDTGLNLDMVARERAAPGGLRRLDLRPAPGDGAAALAVAPDGRARLALDGQRWEGRRLAEGLSRGRYRERFLMRRADGARLTLAVGWEPLAFAMARRDLLRWPAD